MGVFDQAVAGTSRKDVRDDPRRDGRPERGVRHHLWCFIRQWRITKGLWTIFALITLWMIAEGRTGEAWIAGSALGLAVLPAAIEGLTQVRLPRGFVLACGLYVVLTIVMGELSDMYQRVAWWDVAMHAVSGVVLALMGLVIVLTLLGPARKTTGWLLPTLFAWFFAVAIAGLWEVFEFTLDHRFGFSTQNESLNDTMHDMVIGTLAASVGSLAGLVHLLGLPTGPLASMIEGAVRENVKR